MPNTYITAKEIQQQPRLWRETYEIIKHQKDKIEAFLDDMDKKRLRILLTGAGSSAYIGQSVKTYLNKSTAHFFEAMHTTDIVTHPKEIFSTKKPDVIVHYARSGNSPESVATFDFADQVLNDARHIILTCNAEGKLAQKARDHDHALVILMPKDANDKGLAMTGSFSTMVLASLLMFHTPDIIRYKSLVDWLYTSGEAILKHEIYDQLESLDIHQAIYLGSYPFTGLTAEGALKMLELTSGAVSVLKESHLGFRHGPKSALDEKTLVISFLSTDAYVRQYELDLLKEISENEDSPLVTLNPIKETALNEFSLYPVEITKPPLDFDEIFISLPYLLFAQKLAYRYSLKLGINPDNPSPSGQINRVVQGVSIYPYDKDKGA